MTIGYEKAQSLVEWADDEKFLINQAIVAVFGAAPVYHEAFKDTPYGRKDRPIRVWTTGVLEPVLTYYLTFAAGKPRLNIHTTSRVAEEIKNRRL